MAEAIRNALQLKKSAILRAFLSLTLALAAIFVGMYVISGDTFGWFSKNQKVTGSGMSVMAQDVQVSADFRYRSPESDENYEKIEKSGPSFRLYYKDKDKDNNVTVVTCNSGEPLPDGADSHDLYTDEDCTDLFVDSEHFFVVTDSTWADIFAGIYPGDQVHMKVVYQNNEPTAYTCNVFLRPGKETPITDVNEAGKTDFYYFGSQLCVEYAWTGSFDVKNDLITTENNFLVSNADRKVAFPANADGSAPIVITAADTTTIHDGFVLDAVDANGTPGTTTLYFTIEFEYLPANQNNYKFENFNEKNGECTRFIVTDFAPIDS